MKLVGRNIESCQCNHNKTNENKIIHKNWVCVLQLRNPDMNSISQHIEKCDSLNMSDSIQEERIKSILGT